MLISEQTAIISLYSITWFVFITETECVYCAVQTQSLNTTHILRVFKPVVPRLRLIVAGLSLRMLGFSPRSGHLRFMVDRVALGQVYFSPRVFLLFPCQYHSTNTPCSSSSIYTFHLPGQTGEAWEPSKEQYQGALNREVSLSNICKLVTGDLTILIEVFVTSRVAIRLKVKPSITSKALSGIVSAARTAQTTVPARSRHGVGM